MKDIWNVNCIEKCFFFHFNGNIVSRVIFYGNYGSINDTALKIKHGLKYNFSFYINSFLFLFFYGKNVTRELF